MAQKGLLTTADPFIGNEFKRFISCLHNDGLYVWELYARLSFCTACRSSDVRVLKWKDILDDGTQITEKKTGKIRKIPFNKETQDKINELYRLLEKPDKDSYIFTGRHRNKPITIQRINQKLKEFKKTYSLNIEHFSTHSFRKTFGRFVYDRPGDKSANLVMLNVILKHSSIEVTKRYIGLTKDEIDDVFSSISI